jgi:hypothetical protein
MSKTVLPNAQATVNPNLKDPQTKPNKWNTLGQLHIWVHCLPVLHRSNLEVLVPQSIISWLSRCTMNKYLITQRIYLHIQPCYTTWQYTFYHLPALLVSRIGIKTVTVYTTKIQSASVCLLPLPFNYWIRKAWLYNAACQQYSVDEIGHHYKIQWITSIIKGCDYIWTTIL